MGIDMGMWSRAWAWAWAWEYTCPTSQQVGHYCIYSAVFCLDAEAPPWPGDWLRGVGRVDACTPGG